MKKIKPHLPIYDIFIDEDDITQGINLISLVDDPAIEVKGQTFKKFKFYDRAPVHPHCRCRIVGEKWILDKDACPECIAKKQKFDRANQRKNDRNNRKNKGRSSQPGSQSFASDKEEQMIIGVVLVPDKLIYRKDKETGREYYVRFSAAEIKKLHYKMKEHKGSKIINLDHTDRIVDAFIAEDWIVVNEVYDKSVVYNLNAKIGSLVIMLKVKDTEVWNEEVKKLEKSGFSIEGILGHKLVEMALQTEITDEDYYEMSNQTELTDEEYMILIDEMNYELMLSLLEELDDEMANE